MSTPYSGSTAGSQAGDYPPTQSLPLPGQGSSSHAAEGNYAVGPDSSYGQQPPVSGNIGTPMNAEGRPDVENTSVGQLISELTTDLSTLMRQELALAKAEVTTEAKKAGQGAGLFGAAGFAGYMVVVFLSLALTGALASVMGWGWAALITAILWAVIGAVAFVMGRARFKQVHPKPERTVDTLQQVPGALKPN